MRQYAGAELFACGRLAFFFSSTKLSQWCQIGADGQRHVHIFAVLLIIWSSKKNSAAS